MTPTEVNYFLESWLIDTCRGFKYLDYTVYFPEYLIIKKVNDGLYTVQEEISSVKEGPFNKTQMTRLLGADRLICINDNIYLENYKYKKSDGCTCGAWSTRDPEHHSPICEKNMRYR